MKLINMQCNSCGAQLDIDLEHLQAFCPHCGQKLMMDFVLLGQVLSEKEKTKRVTKLEEELTKRTQMIYEHESKEKDKDWKKKVLGILGIVIVYFFIFYYPSFKHDRKVAQLQQIEKEVEAAITAENYDVALVKANQLHCDDYSNKESANWDSKRNSYIEMIQEKKKEQDIKNPNNIFMPSKSFSFKGKNYLDVKNQFTELGFTNITAQEATDKAGFFDKAYTVEHILVGGLTEFTTENYFDKDTPIIIYYYKK